MSAGFFELLGARLILGRAFTDQERVAGARALILSEGPWMRRFDVDRSAMGRAITVDRDPHTIAGAAAGIVASGFAQAVVQAALPEVSVGDGDSQSSRRGC